MRDMPTFYVVESISHGKNTDWTSPPSNPRGGWKARVEPREGRGRGRKSKGRGRRRGGSAAPADQHQQS
eukprot:6209148-Pyramimonas_sp.AAC.1